MAITDTLTSIKKFFNDWHQDPNLHKKTNTVTNTGINKDYPVTSEGVYNALNNINGCSIKKCTNTSLPGYNNSIQSQIDNLQLQLNTQPTEQGITTTIINNLEDNYIFPDSESEDMVIKWCGGYGSLPQYYKGCVDTKGKDQRLESWRDHATIRESCSWHQIDSTPETNKNCLKFDFSILNSHFKFHVNLINSLVFFEFYWNEPGAIFHNSTTRKFSFYNTDYPKNTDPKPTNEEKFNINSNDIVHRIVPIAPVFFKTNISGVHLRINSNATCVLAANQQTTTSYSVIRAGGVYLSNPKNMYYNWVKNCEE